MEGTSGTTTDIYTCASPRNGGLRATIVSSSYPTTKEAHTRWRQCCECRGTYRHAVPSVQRTVLCPHVAVEVNMEEVCGRACPFVDKDPCLTLSYCYEGRHEGVGVLGPCCSSTGLSHLLPGPIHLWSTSLCGGSGPLTVFLATTPDLLGQVALAFIGNNQCRA